MKNLMTCKVLLPSLLGMSLTGLTKAAEFDATLGATGLWLQNHVVGEDDAKEIWPYINLSYVAARFNTHGLGLQTDLDATNTVGAFVTLRRSPIDVDDNNILRNFRDRKDAAELALNWSTKLATMDISTTLATDISDRHDGYEAKVKAAKSYKTQAGVFIPALTLAYLSEDLVDYYYGVSAAEASSSSFAAYQGDDTLVSRAQLTHVFPIGEHWQTITNVSYINLGSGIKDSSIVERYDVWGGNLTVAYKF